MNESLIEFIRLGRKIAPRRTSLICLTYACIENGFIRVTDLETTLLYHLPEGSFQGDFLLPFEVLERLLRLKKIREFPIVLEKVRIQAAGKTLQLDGAARPEPGDFPALPAVEFKEVDRWSPAFLQRLKSHKSYLSTDPLRPALTGLLLRSRGGKRISAATDGHRLIRVQHPEAPQVDYEMILPAKIPELPEKAGTDIRVFTGCWVNPFLPGGDEAGLPENSQRSLPDSDQAGEAPENPLPFLRLEWEDFTLLSRLIPEAYPEIERVIDPQPKGRICFDRAELLEFLNEALTLIPDKFTAAHLDAGGDEFQVTVWINANSIPGEITKMKESFRGTHSGCRFSISFNARYLAEMLKSVSCERITLGYRRWDRASYILLPGETDTFTEIVLMPLREIVGLEPAFPHSEAVAVSA